MIGEEKEPEPYFHWEGGRFPNYDGMIIEFIGDGIFYTYKQWPFNRIKVTETDFEQWGFKKVESDKSTIARLQWRVAYLEEQMREVGHHIEDELRRARREEW